MKALTFSYDDGVGQDRRLIEIFNKIMNLLIIDIIRKIIITYYRITIFHTDKYQFIDTIIILQSRYSIINGLRNRQIIIINKLLPNT